ncbi:hypothetical protein ACFQ3P_04475 [Paraburkholderia sabiae]|uniref:Uncharacterized protein n=1 Tax=Paraburkholderia sabiae TaxID=273251 RepID=A0ABU9QN54_9BURK|nr:hypothetical protein [Paraburkholderia sabiae]WJZ79120.1 hypothetical protein QEN71_34680 [Paraburkholderia sabiae]CAD6514345.1 hypothetical protein LMG24235_00896 [Paraburkholderia sabiae]
MIITFPFEDDPYYSTPQPVSYTTSNSAASTTPALAKKYFDLARSVAGGVFPVGMNRFWHGGVHLKGTKPVRAVADGTIVAYRLDTDYTVSALDTLVNGSAPSSPQSKPKPPRQLSGSFVLIRHECEKNNGANTLNVNRYTGAHFYSLYANLMPAKQLHDKALLPPFVTTGESILPVSALRGDEVTVLAVNGDGHQMAKVRATDINTKSTIDGWIEYMFLDMDPTVPPAVSAKVRLSYPIAALYACHPSERKWRTLDTVKVIGHPVRTGEVIGYPGKTDSQSGVLDDSFHFEIFTADKTLLKPMKSLEPRNIVDPGTSHQDYADSSRSDGMGKVWLTRNADLLARAPMSDPLPTASDVIKFAAGSCFVASMPCNAKGKSDALPDLVCFKLYDLGGNSYYAYASQADAAADGRAFVTDLWVTLTTDSDWTARGWQACEDKELNTTDDAFVEDDDAVMQQILDAACKLPTALNLNDLHSEGVDAILRHTAVRFHTEWDKDHNATRYQKLKTGEHPPLPQMTDAQFSAFLQDVEKQQFWAEAHVETDGVNGPALTAISTKMSPKSWHYHPLGFLAQMRECLTTDVHLSEEAFEKEIRSSWNTGLKLIDKRLKQLDPWKDANAALPSPPAAMPVIAREYATTQNIHNVTHTKLWENFIYWFGVDPNTVATPITLHGALPPAPAGHHVYLYLKGMREFFRHVSLQRVVKGALGFEAGAWVHPATYPARPLVPAQTGFQMECINIGCQYGLFFRAFNNTAAVDQNRMEVQLHEVAHLRNTAHAKDQIIALPAGTSDPNKFNGQTGYGALAARVLAEFASNQALANAENIAFFIESAKHEADITV